jgi:hypothetical protein
MVAPVLPAPVYPSGSAMAGSAAQCQAELLPAMQQEAVLQRQRAGEDFLKVIF